MFSNPAAQAQPSVDPFTVLCAAVSTPVIFNDERDQIIAKWNQLQAFWGTGKAFAQANASVDVKPDNAFCCLKAIGYCVLPNKRSEDGVVGLRTNKTMEEMVKNQQASVTFLSNLLGNKPTLSVCVEGTQPLPNGKCELSIYVIERQPNGNTKKIDAKALFEFLNHVQVSSKLKEAGVEELVIKSGMAQDALSVYLETPPAGIDPALWEKAKEDNPDKERMIPVPMLGFSELESRVLHQEQHVKRHKAKLEGILENLATMRQSHTNTIARIEEFKRKYIELSHRVLCIAAKQEIRRKSGIGVTAEEEQLKVSLEAISQELNAPTKFKGRLSEMLSQIRLQAQLQDQPAKMEGSQYAGFEKVLDEADINAHLKQQQQGLHLLINIIHDDLKDCKLMSEHMNEWMKKK